MENSKDRVLASLNHLQPDQIPIDFGGHRSSGIAAMAYPKLKKALGISSGDIYVHDIIQQLAIVEPDVLDAVGADVVELGRGFLLSDSDWKDWELPDGTPCKIPVFINLEKRGSDWFLQSDTGIDLGIMKKGCFFFEQLNFPWAGRNPDEQDFSDLEEAFAQGMWTATPAPPGLDKMTDEALLNWRKGLKSYVNPQIVQLLDFLEETCLKCLNSFMGWRIISCTWPCIRKGASVCHRPWLITTYPDLSVFWKQLGPI